MNRHVKGNAPGQDRPQQTQEARGVATSPNCDHRRSEHGVNCLKHDHRHEDSSEELGRGELG